MVQKQPWDASPGPGDRDCRDTCTSNRHAGPQQSNQVGELAAIIVAVDSFPRFWSLTIISDSKYAIDGLTIHLHTWEDNGWIGVKNATLFKKAAFLLRRRIATTDFKWTKGHNGTLGNEQSDLLAKAGANKTETDRLPLEIPKDFDLQGAKLATITQATAYRGIRENPPRPPPADHREEHPNRKGRDLWVQRRIRNRWNTVERDSKPQPTNARTAIPL